MALYIYNVMKSPWSNRLCWLIRRKARVRVEGDFKLQVQPIIYKINTHNISGVRNEINNTD